MPMPSLFRYFAVVGSALLGLLLFVNYMAGPAPAPAAVAVTPKIVVQHDSRASLIERWRDEEAARRAAERGEPAVAAVSAPVPVSEPLPTQPEPPQVTAPAALNTAPAEPVPSAETAKAEQAKAVQARKARIARERARAKRQEEAASRQQDQFFYGQPQPAYAPPFAPLARTW